jgi:CRP-like cAMP-binding protein
VEVARDGKLVELARLSSGALFGEMSYLEKSVASANVFTEVAAEVLKVDRNVMRQLLDLPDGFGERFYHSLAVTVSHRLRATNNGVS